MKNITFFLVMIMLISCEKEEGEGGTSTIKGNIQIDEYSKYTKKIVRSSSILEEDVYIVYGDNTFYGDKTKTHNNGNYEFTYLTKGDYQIYVYSEDTNTFQETIIEKYITIKDNKSTYDIPEIRISKIIDEGEASISGKLFAFDYNAELTVLKDSFYLADEYVYVARNSDTTYFNRIKTFYDGSFVFTNLLPGTYEVYAFSKTTYPSGIVAIKKEITIINFYQNIVTDRIEIIK